VAYKLGIPSSLAGVHDIFYVSQLKKCLETPVDVVLPKVTPVEVDLTYLEHLTRILDQKDHVTRRKMIKFFKIQWSNHTEDEAMLALVKHRFHVPTCQVNVWNNHVFTLSTNLVPRF
jgi:hypothetical protein